MQGHRDPNNTLYMINMAAPLREMKEQHIPDTLRANHVYEKNRNKSYHYFIMPHVSALQNALLWTQLKEMPLHPGQDLQWSS